MKHGKSAPVVDSSPSATSTTEQPVVADATPAPAVPSNVPPVVHPVDNPPPAAAGTVTVPQLVALAGKGPLREAMYLVGEFNTKAAGDTSATFRPTVEANGALSGQIRVNVEYPKNAVLPAEDSRVTFTQATRCRILRVERRADKQIQRRCADRKVTRPPPA